MRSFLGRAALALSLLAPIPAAAQAADNPFAPVLYVNNRAVTGYEIEQRAAFLELVRTPGDLMELAREALIDDRLREEAARVQGVTVTAEQVTTGMEEFASRTNLSLDEFAAELGKGGVEPETFRDFVKAGILWRETVRARFAPRVRISDAEVDIAMDLANQSGEVRVLLSEIVAPYAPDRKEDAFEFMNALRDEIRTLDDFADAARRYSRSPTGQAGGELEWMPITNLPAPMQPMILDLGAGNISQVISVPGALVLFYVRGISDSPVRVVSPQQVDFAQFLIPEGPGAPAEIARLRANSDDCDDLYTLARGLPPDRLLRETMPLAQVPADIALELARLDIGESSAGIVRGGWRVFVMLCGRQAIPGEGIATREQMRIALMNREVQLFAENYLRELRADAIIRTP